MKALLALVKGELRAFRRDRTNLFWTLFFPLMFLLIFGSVFGNLGSGGTALTLGVVAPERNPAVDGLLEGLGRVPILALEMGDDLEAERTALERGDRSGVLYISPDTARAMLTGQRAVLEVWTDPTRPTSGQAVLGVLTEMARRHDAITTGHQPTLTLEARQVAVEEDEEAPYIQFLVPGILAMAIMQTGVFVAITMTMRREQLILKRLIATPIAPMVLLGSQGIFRALLAFVQAVVLLGCGALLYKVPIGGNPLLLAALIIAGSASFLALGLAVAAFSRTHQGAMVIAQLMNFVMLFLGGVFWPVDMLPSWMEGVTKALPIFYLADGLRDQLLGLSGQGLALDFGVLTGVTVVALAVATRFMRFEA